MKRLARALLPSQFKTRLRAGLSMWDLMIAKQFSGMLASRAPWFYRLFNTQFDREQIAVLAGRNAYFKCAGGGEQSSPLLRRNIHRLEKGLCMPARRDVFAIDYIRETVDMFITCVENNQRQLQQCSQELAWADAVLTEYFSCTIDHEVITACYLKFRPVSAQLKHQSEQSLAAGSFGISPKIPYQRQDAVKSTLSFADFNTLCLQRRSVRWFTSELVSDELLNTAIQTAAFAPSACNRQPFRFYVANEPKLAAKVAKLAGGTVGFADNIPCTIVVVGDLSAYPSERDRHVIYIDAALASMQLMLALETLGLSSCPINWPDLDVPEQKMAQLLSLAPYERPIMLMAIGYAKPEGLIPYSQKKSVEQLRVEIK
jgi:nitroreductase